MLDAILYKLTTTAALVGLQLNAPASVIHLLQLFCRAFVILIYPVLATFESFLGEANGAAASLFFE